MLVKTLFRTLLMIISAATFVVVAGFDAASTATEFTFNGFRSANLSLDGMAQLTSDGLLMLNNDTIFESGHAFYPDPFNFKNSSNGDAFSFSTEFVFAMRADSTSSVPEGIAFVISPTKSLPGGRTLAFIGLFNQTTNASTTNHIFAVELDSFQNPDVPVEINANHVGVDVTNINSVKQEPAGYYSSDEGGNNAVFHNLTLLSGDPMQAWVDYDGTRKEINVTLAPMTAAGKPRIPLLNFKYDLSTVLQETMYVGFSSATGPLQINRYVLGWSFRVNGGAAPQLDLSMLPKLPRLDKASKSLTIVLVSLGCFLFILAAISGVIFYVRRKKKFAEVLEDWEVAYGTQRFRYKDLYTATKGFKSTELLGAGGFGRVYRGVLPTSKIQIAVKKVSHESGQGMRQFIAEIASIGRMSHRNIVKLLGYCRRKGELLLVYECMPNGSLDKFLYGQSKFILNWNQRFRIIKGVASGLFYIHQGWEQVVVHRDLKSSNVLLDAELNGRIGDFGLARLYDHGTDPQTTHVVGTVGYLAPEHYRTGRATTSSDVYAFGAFLLEVVCGRRPIETSSDIVLVECVFWLWNEGRILEAVDPNLGGDYTEVEAELVLKLGLFCCNLEPKARPSMQQVLLYLDGSMPLPDLSSVGICATAIAFSQSKSFEDVSPLNPYPSSTDNTSSQYASLTESILSCGR